MCDKQKPYGEITLKDIEEAVNYVFREKPKKDPNERVFKFATYCRGLNTTVWFSADSTEGPPFCDHPECFTCREYEKAFKEAAKDWKPEVWHGEKRGESDHYLEVKPRFPLVPSEIVAFETQENMTAKELIEKYGDLLSKEQLDHLKKYE